MEQLLNEKQTAKLLSVSEEFLQGDRWRGPTIPYVKVGNRAVRYRVSDLEKFLESRLKTAPVVEG